MEQLKSKIICSEEDPVTFEALYCKGLEGFFALMTKPGVELLIEPQSMSVFLPSNLL
jgi:hypothetical protein